MLTFRSSWESLHILRRLVPSWRPCHGFSSSPSRPGQGSWRRTFWTYTPGWCPGNWGCPRTSLLLLGSLLRQKSATDGSWDRWINTRKRKGACNVSSRSSSRILSPQNQGSYFSWFQKTHRWKKHPGRRNWCSGAPRDIFLTHLKWFVRVEISEIETGQEEFPILMSSRTFEDFFKI